MIRIKRVYEPYNKTDGYRILIDRLWPRGLSKEKAHIDEWMKEIAPSTQLRKWFGHDPEKWKDIKKKYTKELEENSAFIEKLQVLQKKHPHLTLVYGAKDTKHNDAVVLKVFLEK